MIILDTHAWIWWAAKPSLLSRRARTAIEGASELGICAISVWEVAMLVGHGRLVLDRDVELWIKQALALPKVSSIPLSPEIAVSAATLPRLHGDPADRMIAATALSLRAPLVTKDTKLRSDQRLNAMW